MKLSVVLKVFVLVKFLFAFLFFNGGLLFFWGVLSNELSSQVTRVDVVFTVVLISVSCFIVNAFVRFSSMMYSISSLRERECYLQYSWGELL